MENKICFLGNTKDFSLAAKLYSLVSEALPIQKRVAVVEKDYIPETEESFDAVSIEFGTDKNAYISEKLYTYCIGQSNADICGLNFQKREISRSLELLSGSFMGRVNIPVNSEFTEASVLYCAAGFLAAEVPLATVLKAVNEKVS